MKYRIVIEWAYPPAMTYGKFKYDTPEDALGVAKTIQDQYYPKVYTYVEDQKGKRYDHEVKDE